MYYPQDPANVEQSHPKLSSMAIVGHTTPNSCKLWVRVYRPGHWWLVLTKQPLSGNLDTLGGLHVKAFVKAQAGPGAKCLSARIDGSSDNTHTWNISGLAAGTRYYYAVIADLEEAPQIPRRTEIGHQQPRFFDTPTKVAPRFSFGYFSCHDPFSNGSVSEGAWPLLYESLVDKQALFLIGGGDQVYVDTNKRRDMYSIWDWLAQYKNAIIADNRLPDGSLDSARLIDFFTATYRSYYRLYWNFASVKRCFARFPVYMIWDDHEIMDGWGSYTRAERRKLLNKLFQDDDEATNDQLIQLMFAAAKRVYLEYQHSHNPDSFIALADPAQNPLCEWDYAFSRGDSAFYVLDMRGHHDYERTGSALLGEHQMQRFAAWLQGAASTAKSIFVVSPVPIVHWNGLVTQLDIGPVKDDIRDEWEHESNHTERNRLLHELLAFSHQRGVPVTVLSGDVHCASAYRIEHDAYPAARLFNVTSSAISRKPAPAKAELLIRKSGPIDGFDGGSATRLYALSGQFNYLIVTADHSAERAEILIELCWPGGDDGETSRKRLVLSET